MIEFTTDIEDLIEDLEEAPDSELTEKNQHIGIHGKYWNPGEPGWPGRNGGGTRGDLAGGTKSWQPQ